MITIQEQVAVAYAYPDSAQAKLMGRPHTGSWYIQNYPDFILADGPRDAAAMAQQMIDGGYHRSPMCMTNAETWDAILNRFQN